MSQLNSGYGRPSVPQAPRLNEPGSLSAPGLAVAPPVSRGVQMAGDLLQAFGVAGGAAGQIGDQFARTRRNRERDQAENEQLFKGQASLDARTALPELLQKIQNREVLVPEGMPVAEYVTQLLDDELSAVDENGDPVMPAAYADTYRQLIQPTLTAAFVDQQQAMIDEAKGESLQLLREAAVSATGVDDIAAAYQQSITVDPSLTETQRLAAVVLPALQSAAENGDRTRFQAAAKYLGDRFPAERLQAEAVLALRVRQQRSQASNAQADEFNDILASRLSQPQPDYEAAREFVRAAPVSESTRLDALDQIDRREASLRAELRKQMNEQEKTQAQEAMNRYIDGLLLNADGTGGATAVPENDQLVIQGTFEEFTFNRDALIKARTDAQMERFAEQAPTPEAALAQQVQFLSRSGTTYDRYERVMAAGALAVTQDLHATGEAPEQLPANLVNGYELYKRIGAMNPRLRDKHIKSEDVADFYRYAEIAESYITPGDQAAALNFAARAMARRSQIGGPAARFDADAMKKALDTVTTFDPGWLAWEQQARNLTDIGGKLQQTARVYMEALGVSADVAVEEAMKDIQRTHVISNGWLVNTAGVNVPDSVPELASLAAEDYAAAFGQAEGVEAGDLALIPGETDATWVLVNMNTMTPAEQWRQGGVGTFTNADLRRFEQEKRATLDEQVRRQVIADQNESADRRGRGKVLLRDKLSGIAADYTFAAGRTVRDKSGAIATLGGTIDYGPAGSALAGVGRTAWERIKATPGGIGRAAGRGIEKVQEGLDALWNIEVDE